MKLPVTTAASPEGQWRRLADVWVDHALAVGDESPVAGARVVLGNDALTRSLAGTAVLPTDASADAVTAALAEFDMQASAWPVWLDPVPDSAAAATLADHGYRRQAGMLWTLARASPPPADAPAMILPGRSAWAAYTAWCGRRKADDPAAAMLPRHLDDPQYELLVGLRRGKAVAAVGLQSRGQTGLVCDLFVDPSERRRGLAFALLAHAADLAARAQLAEVFAVSPADDAAACGALRRGGFSTGRPITIWLPSSR